MGNFYRGFIHGTPRSHSVGIDWETKGPSLNKEVWISPVLKLVVVREINPETNEIRDLQVHDLAAFTYANINREGASTLQLFVGEVAQIIPDAALFPDEFKLETDESTRRGRGRPPKEETTLQGA